MAVRKRKAANSQSKKPQIKKERRLGEVFGYCTGDFSEAANQARSEKLCRFRGGLCSKVSKGAPLGVCSMTTNGDPAILCPTRFLEGGIVARGAATFLFPGVGEDDTQLLPEIKLPDSAGRDVGRVDVVLVHPDAQGNVVDFGACEIQSVYTQGGGLKPAFDAYLKAPQDYREEPGTTIKPSADYRSSRKRLNQQLLVKGSVFTAAWGKKMAVVVDKGYFARQPDFERVPEDEAEMAWLVYDLWFDPVTQRFQLIHVETAYTMYQMFHDSVATAPAGKREDYQTFLSQKLSEVRRQARTRKQQLALTGESLAKRKNNAPDEDNADETPDEDSYS